MHSTHMQEMLIASFPIPSLSHSFFALTTKMNFSQNGVPNMIKPPKIAVSFLFCLCFQMFFTIHVTSYSPVDDFAVLCGDSGDFLSLDHRNWTGDSSSTRFSLIDQQLSVKAQSPMSEIPYKTARVSGSEFSYSFPLTNVGQKFIRLYFYPYSYNSNFLRSDAFFSVKAGPHTLLKDFNASLNADDADEDPTIKREYLVNVDQGRTLTLTFTPNLSSPNAYAFINGIEVVSMPDYLYYTAPDNLHAMMLNGETSPFTVKNSNALETMYRINVGGSQIPAAQDTGMFRMWDEDVQYLEVERAHSVSAAFHLKLTYRDDQNYFAPDQVYMTARNYGMNETSKYNVTWEFQVDSNFTYMVRLHFCEFDQAIQKAGERVFQIFIDDYLVEPHADVVQWSGGNLIPVHKDYAVLMRSQGSLKKMALPIRLRPDPYGTSVYKDVLLNGIEILKISDDKDNLGGANPDPRPSPMPFMPPSKSSKNGKKMIMFAVVGSCSGFVVISLILFLIFRRLTKGPAKEGSSWWGQKSEDSSKKNKSRGSTLPLNLCRYFSIDEIRAATNNFDDIFIVGVGGFGNVYKGYIDDGTVPVAIKRLKQGSQQGLREFQTEIEMLSQLRHRHLVSLIGYCNDGNEMILVYEFMAHGTLREHIYDCESESEPLSWKQRLEMCLGAARGLHYLHTDANHKIIHRDVKTKNILIDEKWVAKVSDFGLSKIGPTGMSKSHISTTVKGSVGYLDPEYLKRQRLTEKSDVYSFGVVLLEVLCGRPPLIRNVEKQKSSLVEWVRKCHREGVIHQTVDPLLIKNITPECLKAFSDMALKCLVDDGNERPSMNDVVWGLEFALQLQESTEEVGLDVAGIEGKSEERSVLRKGTNVEESKVGFTSSDESKGSRLTTSSSEDRSLVASGSIFSELGHPTVR